MRDFVVIGPGGRRPLSPPPAQPLLRTTLGHLLRRIRREQSRTLADVARAARVSMPYLSELERGRKEASSEILAAVCGALRIELSDLLAEAGRSLAADRARRALMEERARRRRERAGQLPDQTGEPAGRPEQISAPAGGPEQITAPANGTAPTGGDQRAGDLRGAAPADVRVVVPLDAVRGRRVPGPRRGPGDIQATLAA